MALFSRKLISSNISLDDSLLTEMKTFLLHWKFIKILWWPVSLSEIHLMKDKKKIKDQIAVCLSIFYFDFFPSQMTSGLAVEYRHKSLCTLYRNITIQITVSTAVVGQTVSYRLVIIIIIIKQCHSSNQHTISIQTKQCPLLGQP